MVHILLCSTPFDGHVVPMLAVSRALVESGSRVRFLTGERYADKVSATGAEFLALPPDACADLDVIMPQIDREVRAKPGSVPHLKAELRRAFLAQLPGQFRVLRELLAAEPADAVVTDAFFFGAGAFSRLPRHERRPVIACGVTPVVLLSEDTAPPPFGMRPIAGPLGRARNRLLNWVIAGVVFRDLQREFDEAFRSASGSGLDTLFLDWFRGADAYAQLTVPAFEYSRRDAPANLEFIGPMRRPARPDATLPDWWDDLDRSRPLVHVTQGTVANLDLDELVIPAIRGLAQEAVEVVVTTGGAPIDAFGDPPANTHVEPFIDHAVLMPHVDVFVTNGGYGGVHAALEHGVPIVVAGVSEDKRETSARIAWSGVGVNLRTGTPTARHVRDGVRRVLADRRYRERARRIARDIGASPGAAGLVAIVERLAAAPPADGAVSLGTVRPPDGRASA